MCTNYSYASSSIFKSIAAVNTSQITKIRTLVQTVSFISTDKWKKAYTLHGSKKFKDNRHLYCEKKGGSNPWNPLDLLMENSDNMANIM